MVAAVAVVVGVGALVLPEHGTGEKPFVALATVSLAIGAASLIGTYLLSNAVIRFERLDAGVGELARWWIDPPTWRQFAAADRARQAGLEPRWGENVLIVAEEIAAPLEIVVSREAVRVGEAYHELDRDIMLGTRLMPGTPVMLEFYFKIIKPRGLPVPFIVRFPVAAGAEHKAQAALAHYNQPIVYGRFARAIMIPGQAARRNPRKARNIALGIAGAAAFLGAACISAADSETMRAFGEEDPGAVLLMVAAITAPVVAVTALVLAAVWHWRGQAARL